MAKTRDSASASRAGPSVEALQKLAKTLCDKKDLESKSKEKPTPAECGGEPRNSEPSSGSNQPAPRTPPRRTRSIRSPEPRNPMPRKSAPATNAEPSKDAEPKNTEPRKSEPTRTVEPEPKKRRVTGKQKGVTDDTEDNTKKVEVFDKNAFDPSSLPFALTWDNFAKLKSHYKLSDSDTTAILIATCGPCEEGKRYWERYRVSTSEPKPTSMCPDKSPRESDDGETIKDVAKATSLKSIANAENLKKVRTNKEQGDERKIKAAKTSKTDEPMVEPEKPAPKTHNGRRIVKVQPDTQPPSDHESEYKYEDSEEEDVMEMDPVTEDDEDSEDDILSTCRSRGSDDHPPPAPPRASQVGEADETVELAEIRSEPVKQPIDEEALDAKHALKESLKSVATPAKAET